MPSLGWQELLLILVIVIIIFGVGKLPEIGGAMGKGIREFRANATDDGDKSDSADVNTNKPIKEEL
jgi:sec-independent protein translocase protein TatA